MQRLLSDEQHGALLKKIKVRSSARMKNLLLACTMPHASDWLHAPPIPGLGLSLKTDVFRTGKVSLRHAADGSRLAMPCHQQQVR